MFCISRSVACLWTFSLLFTTYSEGSNRVSGYASEKSIPRVFLQTRQRENIEYKNDRARPLLIKYL